MTDCIFCDIITRRAPALVVDEDAAAIAFLPLHMEAPGHTLIVPKTHAADFRAASPEVLAAVLALAQRVARRYGEILGATGFNLLHAAGGDAGQSVAHLHLHLIPRWPSDGLDAWPRLPDVEHDPGEFLRRLQGENQG